MKVLSVSGSLRRDSHNRRLLHAAARELPGDVQFEEWTGLADIPAYDEDRDPTDAVRDMRAAFAAADAVLIATPEYNHSVPGALKNALDWASRPFPHNSLEGTPAAVIGASTGIFGAIWAQAELRKVLGAIGAQVVDLELPVGSAESAFDDGGNLVDADQREQLQTIVEDLATPPDRGFGSAASRSMAAAGYGGG